jgi:hypothetical protein
MSSASTSTTGGQVTDMRIYVPSAGRAGNIGVIGTTLDFVSEAVLVVPGEEAEAYRRASQRYGGKVSVTACAIKGIAGVRKFIGECAKHGREEKFCMMDDDLRFDVRVDSSSYKLQKATRDDVQRMTAWISAQLRDDVAHASVSIRMANNAFPTGDVDALTKFNKRTLRVLAYQTDKFLAMRHGRVTVMEDFDVNLQLLRGGYRNATTFWWSQDQRGTGTKGGCSTYRTLEAHNASARKLAELHPQFVKLRNKHTKTSSPEMRDRLEVSVQWEQAYRSSQMEKVR